MIRRRPRLSIAVLLGFFAGLAGQWLYLGWQTPTPFGWRATLAIVAGDGAKGHADGSRARFSDPFGIAIDRKGIVYVADAGDTNRIRRIDRDGVVTTLPGKFDTPSGLAIDGDGNIIVADTGANAIRKMTPEGVVTTLAGDGMAGFRDGAAGQARFNGPIGVAADGQGNVYVADSYNDRIRLITAKGEVKTLAGRAAPGFADGQGEGAAFDTPSGLAIDRDGALLIADTGNDAVRRLDKEGRVTTLVRPAPDGSGLLRSPVGIAATWDGFIYVSSYRRGRIVQISPTGEATVLTGPDASVARNRALRLASPAGLALDRKGALFIADASKYAVRKLALWREGDPASTDIETAPPGFVHAARFPWPFAPQDGWHEIVGDLGEVRGNYQGEPRDHLHAGLDIHGDVGVPVLAVAAEKVSDPIPNWSFDGLSEGMRIDALTYIHMRVGRRPDGAPLNAERFQLLRDAAGKVNRVRVKRGTRFRVGDPLGTVNRMAHTHLELGVPGGQINAFALRFANFSDHVPPHIDRVWIEDPAGKKLTEQQAGRVVVRSGTEPFDIVIDAWDQVDRNEPRRRLGLYKAGFQILHADGSPVTQPRIDLVFDRMPLDSDAVKIVYAPSSGDAVHSDQATRFLYVVSNKVSGGRASMDGWRPAALPPGNYIIRVTAADFAGNVAGANRDLPITIVRP